MSPNYEKYEHLGREFGDNLARSDGASVAKSLHAYFEQDLRDWFYDEVLPYFSGIPEDDWSQSESITAEFNCRQAVSFFQSVRGAAVANERGHVSVGNMEWYTNWLMRLNLGESSAKQATEGWLRAFNERDREGQLELFSAAMSECLPEIQGKFFLLHVYAPTLDLRVQATTARAFGDGNEAQKLHAEAVSMEQKLDAAIREYSTGGGVCYVLESDQGLLITQSQRYGALFHLWLEPDYAKEMNEGQYGGIHRISPMDYRELEGQLRQFQSAGLRYATVDRRMNGEYRLVAITDMLQHVQQKIAAVDSSVPGKAMANVVGKRSVREAAPETPEPAALEPTTPEASNPKLMSCPDCEHTVSRRADSCPSCGAPLNPSWDTSKREAAPANPEPATPEPAISDAWWIKSEDGKDYGPATKAELDQWLQEGRINEDCQILREGASQWRWASDIYPELETEKE